MNNLKTAIFSIGVLLSRLSAAQQLPPVGSLPMIYNGGFAGEGNNGRFRAGVKLNSQYTFFGSYDQFVSKISTGIGFTAVTSLSQGSVFILSISPKISLKGKYTFAPFIDASYGTTEYQYGTEDYLSESSALRTGFLLNGDHFYFGYSTYLLETVNEAKWLSNPVSVIQGGYCYQKLPDSNFSLTPQIVLNLGGGGSYFQLTDFSLIARYKKLLAGINSDGMAVGYQNKKFKVLMSQSYLLSLNGEVADLFYSHTGITVAMRYIFDTKRKTPFD